MIDINVSYNSLLKNMKRESYGCTKLSIAVLADFASQHLSKALKAAALDFKLNVNIWEAEYDAIQQNVYDENSELYFRNFDYIIIFHSAFKLYKEFSYSQEKENFTKRKSDNIRQMLSVLQERTIAKIILSNYAELDDGVFGAYANRTKRSFLYHVRSLNVELMNLAIEGKNLYLTDIQSLISLKGRLHSFNPQLYVHADIVFDLDFLALAACKTMQIVAAAQGHFKKCVVLDLDNTLWGGIIGDDGIENIQIGSLGLGKAFSNFQLWLRNLKERGILLAVCSKNTEEIAKDVFRRHPEMTLHLEDIAVFVANWETKVDNIRFIQSILNIGFDTMVFLDDNPFERAIVRQHIPDITVPELPEDPAEYLPYLQSLGLFETALLTDDDQKRTMQYQQEAERSLLQKTFLSEADFLKSLQMKAVIEPVNNITLSRVAQLTQRSNQFNLRTVRYSEEDIARLMNDPETITLTVTLKDIFGDYGLISAVVLNKISDDTWFIDTWIMSCRVLKRGVEACLLNELVELAKEKNIRFLEGQYIPTAKNGLVKDHYRFLGFEALPDKDRWRLEVFAYKPLQISITKTNAYVNHE